MTNSNATGRHGSAIRLAIALSLAAFVASGCQFATDVDRLEIRASGALFGQVVIDADGSESITPPDEALAGAQLLVRVAGTGELVATAVTGSGGTYEIPEIPVGSYVLDLDPDILGDSLIFAPGSAQTVAAGAITRADLRTSFPELSLDDVLTARLGLRVISRGIALNPRVNFGDGQVHFRGSGAFLRTLDVERSTLSVGDNIRFLGRVVSDNGRPALQSVRFSILLPEAALVLPEFVDTRTAGTADDGDLDAALVDIRSVSVSDTATTPDGHFRFLANDGSGAVEVWVRDFLGLNTSLIPPGTEVTRVIGLLSPVADGAGSVRWRLLPRVVDDIVLSPAPLEASLSPLGRREAQGVTNQGAVGGGTLR